ncbi:hypothetical protein [Oryza sativa Japonica Group]|uniref:Uncharacterized protein B1147A04.38 n=1 Tax=Oryza sativa subsp. japonica TaxID=39947 RepID=Q5JKW9_ORYSJ|nr:hypothetical protein [Oryza sativa Japonica Group]
MMSTRCAVAGVSSMRGGRRRWQRSVRCRGGRLGGACSGGREGGGAVVAAGGLRAVLRAVVVGGLRVVVALTPPCRHCLEVGGAECVDGDGIVRAKDWLVVVVAVAAPLQIPEGRGKTMGCAISPRTTVVAEPEG